MIQTMTVLSSPIARLDYRVIFEISLRHFVPWIAIVLTIGTVAGTGLSCFAACLNMQRKKPTA